MQNLKEKNNNKTEMKILTVCSRNNGKISPFITDQVEALKNEGIEVEYFHIDGKGLSGYLKEYKKLIKRIKKSNPDIVHAHYGFSGLLSVLQRKKPVVTTFHGCDVNVAKNRFLSQIASYLSTKSIFVSEDLSNKINQKNSEVIPCGVDLGIFYPRDNIEEIRKKFNLDKDKKYILFSSSFSNPVKNYPLAKDSVLTIKDIEIELIELKGYSRSEVSMLLNAVDAVLLTSIREGSPQFIKEAMACNCPIVTTDVGDIRDVIGKTDGCYIASNNSVDISKKIRQALSFERKTNGRKNINHFDNKLIANNIIDIYNSILKNY